MIRVNGQFNIKGDFVGGDKSISHRALILSAIASGESVIRNLSLCQDVMSTCDCLRALGATITLDGTTARVSPIITPNNGVTLDCKNSGTTARLLAGLVAGLGVQAKFVGDKSLSARPMDRVLNLLRQMGAAFAIGEGVMFESLGGKLKGTAILSEVNSAQVKSAVLLAGLRAEGSTTYVERVATRNHTELMLACCGANLDVNGLSVTVEKSSIKPLNINVPRDVSSVSFLIALALLTGRETRFDNVLLNERRIGMMRVLQRSGADITFEKVSERFGEKVGDIVVKPSRLTALNASQADVCDAIDEVPILCVIAALTKGKHVFREIEELKHKESDRVAAIRHMAEQCGAATEVVGNNLLITSTGVKPTNPRLVSCGDHRIAMCEIVISIVCGGGSLDSAPYGVSFPEFLQAVGVNSYKFALIGENVSASKSPKLMEFLSGNANKSCSYETVSLPRTVSDEELLLTIKRYDGVNITMPYKTRVASLLDADVPSVNTVGKNIRPCSTDGYGLVKSLQANGVNFVDKPLWIVGAGGAAEECVKTLASYGCKMQIINRTQSHADELTAKYGLTKNINEPYGVLSFVPECDFEKNIQLPSSAEFVFVAAYKGASGLKDMALKRGIKYIDGLEMLYHQGAESFSLWTNTPLQDDYNGFVKFIKE